jgi:hypothetical protein
MTIDPKVIVAAAEVANKIVPKTLQEVDNLGGDILKTIRLILAPLQLSAAWQDRLSSYIERAIKKVPESRRIMPAESIALPAAERLRFQEESNPITELYINLLARAMDGQRVGEAHPAFVTIISQMAPDELLFLQDAAKRTQSIILSLPGHTMYPTIAERDEVLSNLRLPVDLTDRATNMMFGYEKLNQPEMFPIFQEHLQHLGLIEYVNDLQEFREYTSNKQFNEGTRLRLFSIRLTNFGRLFLKSCTDDPNEQSIAT